MMEEAQNDQPSRALTDALSVSFKVLRFVMIGLLIVYLVGSAMFVVRSGETVLILRAGRVREIVREPGLQWSLPYPIDEIIRIPSGQAQSIESDTFWYYRSDVDRVQREDAAPGKALVPGKDGYVLTGDANILHSRWVLRYRISDPEALALRFANLDRLLHRELDHAIVAVCTGWDVESVRNSDEAFTEAVQALLADRCHALKLGVVVEGVDLVEPIAPRQVQEAFDEATAAKLTYGAKVAEAKIYKSGVISEANGRAAQLEAQSNAYRDRMVSEISADAAYFEKVYEKYRENPDITVRTLLQDTLKRTLAKAETKYVLHRDAAGKLELRLLLTQEEE